MRTDFTSSIAIAPSRIFARIITELAEAKRRVGDDRYSSIAHSKAVGFYGATAAGYWGVPKLRALFETTYFAGLRRAVVPEE